MGVSKTTGEPEVGPEDDAREEGDTRAVSASELAAVLARVDGRRSDAPPTTRAPVPAEALAAMASPRASTAAAAPPPKDEGQISGARPIVELPAPEPAPVVPVQGPSREVVIALAVLSVLLLGLAAIALR